MLPDEIRRKPLSYQERIEMERLLHELWIDAGNLHYNPIAWARFSNLAERASRIPPGPDGGKEVRSATYMGRRFRVGGTYDANYAAGMSKVTRIRRIKIIPGEQAPWALLEWPENHGLGWTMLT